MGNELNQHKELMIKYGEVVGNIELGNLAFHKVNKLCNTNFVNSDTFLKEVDYYLRQNTGYTFKEAVQLMDREKESELLAAKMVDDLVEQNGGCNTASLEDWYSFITHYNEQEHLMFLRENKSIFGFPRINRTESYIQQEFKRRIKSYRNLPYKELFDLASALESGSYRYSMLGLSQNISKNNDKAIDIWKFAIKKFNEPQAYFYLGKSLQLSSTAKAFISFKESAKQGYKHGEIWLGTYYACNKDIPKAKYWLEIAKANYRDPDYIDDIVAEIDDLGMPTNCMDGWVY